MPAAKYLGDQRDSLLQLVSEGLTKTAACAKLGIPVETVTSWIVRDDHFGDRWRAARIEQAHSLADEALAIAEEDVGDNMAAAQRNRLRVDTRKWFTSKIAPKLYGERITNDHTHTVGVVVLPSLQVAAQALKGEARNKLLQVHPVTPARASHRGETTSTGEPRDHQSDGLD